MVNLNGLNSLVWREIDQCNQFPLNLNLCLFGDRPSLLRLLLKELYLLVA